MIEYFGMFLLEFMSALLVQIVHVNANSIVSVVFMRIKTENKQVYKKRVKHRLPREKNGLQIYFMVGFYVASQKRKDTQIYVSWLHTMTK